MPCHGDSEIPGCPPGGLRRGQGGSTVTMATESTFIVTIMLSVPNRTLLYASRYDVTVMSFRSGSKNSSILEYRLNIRCKSACTELGF
ncbi:hypothetical protein QQF64_022553 [Cirrhinus molitorella]|uniref:Uncharacterized protein n=1 Tax=Cirrhinus molitorella TaxID=172907 RepID=A0ABR3L2Y8_9TELE